MGIHEYLLPAFSILEKSIPLPASCGGAPWPRQPP